MKQLLIYLLFSLTLGYKYYSYKEIIDTFIELADKNKQNFKLYYPLEGLENLRYLDCGEKECEFFYAEYANNFEQNNLPTILIAAGFHGDEIIGQNVVTELAKYLVSNNKLDFLNYRRIILYPMVNPYGYYHKVREEMGKDANRDFNIDNPSSICFQTNAARGLIQVYKKYIIQMGITFHGGDNSISYSWGTFNHLQNNLSTEPPDDSAFTMIGQILRDLASQNKKFNIEQYTLGRMTDQVYAVRGGYEDWAYGAAWDKVNQCGNRNKEEYTQPSNNARALTYLIEAGYQKQPNENTLGKIETQIQLLQQWPPIYYYDTSLLNNYESYGHINRNLMASLALIDISHPYLSIQIKNNNTIILNFGGCDQINSIGIINQKNETIYKGENKTGIWSKNNKGLELQNISLTDTLFIQYKCDSIYLSHQRNPDPKISPQSYFVQNRINNTYKYQQDKYEIENTFLMSHKIQFENRKENDKWILNQNENLLIEFNTDIQITEKGFNNNGSNQKQKVWWLLSIFILLSCVLTVLFWKYCQKRQQEEVMEMYTIQNEVKL